MRTKTEIDQQIAGLEKREKTLPEYSNFGDPNWKAIDAQIKILKGEKNYEDYVEAEDYVEQAAYTAKEWMDGDINEDLFSI